MMRPRRQIIQVFMWAWKILLLK
nr:unnamed protein product [Callosobruchus analis]